MKQLQRLISILTLLKSKRLLTATELSDKYEVSVRTIYRDIRKLEEAGVPIVTIDGKGYSLMEGYMIAPVQFTEKEANALITAQRLVKQTRDDSFANHYEDAMTKIKSVFRTSILEKSELLDKNMVVLDTINEPVSSNALSELQLAITNFRVTEITYRKANDFETTQRVIEPCALYSANHRWILVAWCRLRDSYRSFRIDRMMNFRIMEENFEDRKFDLQAHFRNEFH